jgi:glycosyltransferase involved in cell wall biosynthesis
MSSGQEIAVIGSFADSLINFRGPLLQAMVDRGHRVVACAPAAPAAVVDALAATGVAYRDVPLKRAGMRLDQDLRALYSLVRLFQELRPDVVLTYTIKPVTYGLLAARFSRVPRRFAMITGLGYAFIAAGLRARLVGAAARRLYRWSLEGADRVFFQNPDDQALFEELRLLRAPDQTVMINGSGVDLEAFRPTPLPGQPASFLLIARLLQEKGVREYVEAARQMRAKGVRATFHLVGWLDEGNPAAISKQELHGWIADGVIHYHGQLDDVRPAIAKASVYVLPSYREGTPRTVLEAMAMGRPIVTTDAPGCRATVQHGVNGFLVPIKDASSLAQAMELFVKKPDLAQTMGRESRRIAEERYNVHQVNSVILEAMGLA